MEICAPPKGEADMSLGRCKVWLGALAPMALLAPDAAAQDTGAPGASAAADDAVIIVTARKTAEDVQSTPVAVSVFSDADLAATQAENVGALQGAVPNLNIVQGRGSSSSANIYIRGIGQPDALATFDPAVGVYVDDVYISRIRGALFDVYDIERIEVLRGPQGTLYGKNTIGGALKVVTRKPGDDLRADARVTFGDYNALEASGRVSGPIVEGKLAAGAVLYRGQRDGYVTDPVTASREYNNKDTTGGRLQLRFTPGPKFEALAAFDYTQESPNLTVGRQEALLFSIDQFPNGLPGVRIVPRLAPPTGEFNYRTTTTLGLPNTNELEHKGLSLTLSYDLNGSATLKSITARRLLDYQDYIDIDATALEIGDVFVGVEQDQTSQEFQLTYDAGGKVSGVAGVYWLNENIQSTQVAFADDFLVFGSLLFPPNGRAINFRRDIGDDLNLHSVAAYGQAQLRWTDRLRTVVGLRLTGENKSYWRFTTTTSGLAGAPQTTSAPFAFSRKGDWTDASPMFGLDYQASDTVFYYAKIAKGFKSGGFNGRANSAREVAPYDPEVAISYEAGVKSRLFDNRLIANATVFFNNYQDFQARVSQPNPANPADFQLAVLNAGKLETSGAEIEVRWRPLDPLLLTADVGYLKADYKEFRDLNAAGGDRSWQTPAFSPEWTARFGAAYEVPFSGFGTLTFGADANFRSEAALAVDNANLSTRARFPGMWQDDFWVYNARVAWVDPSERFSITAGVKNLTDEVYKTDAQEFSSVGGIQTAYYGAPRTVALTLGVRY
jgi:iron complex outermembrane receptor protein